MELEDIQLFLPLLSYNYFTAEDLASYQRSNYKLLKQHFVNYRSSGKYKKCYIQDNYLVLDAEKFLPEEILDLEKQEKTTKSTPETPNVLDVDATNAAALILPRSIHTNIHGIFTNFSICENYITKIGNLILNTVIL